MAEAEAPQAPRLAASTRDLLESAGLVILTFVGAAYVAGVLIINLRLSSLGVPAPDLTEPRYVIVGMLWLFLVAIATEVSRLFIHGVEAGVSRYRKGQRFLGVAHLLVGAFYVFSLSIVIMVVSRSRLDFEYRETWWIVFILVITSVNLRPIGENATELWKSLQGEKRDRGSIPYSSAYGVLWQTVILLLSVSSYALFAYPRLAPVFGGGRPTEIILLTAPATADTLRLSGLPVLRSGRTGTLRLLFEDSTNYFVELQVHGAPSSVRVRKDSVAAAIHLPSR